VAGNGLYIHWAILGVLALFIAIGLFYRVSAPLFFLGWTYIFLLDEAQWVNHTYLISLFSFLLIFAPANRAFSADAWLNPKRRSQTAPAWTLWLLRAQMGVVYFFAGVAKISPDWLDGEPPPGTRSLSGPIWCDPSEDRLNANGGRDQPTRKRTSLITFPPKRSFNFRRISIFETCSSS
jgi:hypothetical protein